MSRSRPVAASESCVLVTGGAGFMGSTLVRQLLNEPATSVVNYDCLTYAAVSTSLSDVETDPRYCLVQADICDGAKLAETLAHARPRVVLHLAAETHVDRSIARPPRFVATNVTGTSVVLEQTLHYWRGLSAAEGEGFRLVLASTDEVFGSAADEQRFDAASPLLPNSPYAASKAAAEHLARAYRMTYGLPVVIANPTNNYGPRQSPEKLIPKMIVAAQRQEPLPLYGDGRQERDWLHVEDCCTALRAVARQGVPGQRYLIGSGVTRTNWDVVRQIERLVASAVGKLPPTPSRVRHVADRLGHDRRYAVDAAVAQRELGWAPRIAFDAGLAETVRWYLGHPEWTALAEQALAARDRDDLSA